ncbi:MAG: hypothetical protein Q8916_09190 [Bacteroidota bacterium]|nr:hypothetical protein [Bacteroidota bacterium]MDP4230561.1 hypothetical protein [Bacteroidota bacterium]
MFDRSFLCHRVILRFLLIACIAVCFLYSSNCSAQYRILPGFGIDSIQEGYSTRADIFKQFGAGGDTLREHFVTPSEEAKPSPGLVRPDEVYYRNLGIHFVIDDDGELVSEIFLSAPFKGYAPGVGEITLGKTTYNDLFRTTRRDSLAISTTRASSYWSIEYDSVQYFIPKAAADSSRSVESRVRSYTFDESLPFIQDEKIAWVSPVLPFSNRYTLKTFTKNDTTFSIPLYAPESELHLNASVTSENPINCFTYGEGAWPQLKAGYWRIYHPNHVLAAEGYYDDNKEIGIFKYYDESGRFTKSVDYGSSSLKIKVTYILVILIVAIYWFARRKRRSHRGLL